MNKNLIFNPEGNDAVSARTIIKGSTTGLFNLNDVKYPWAKQLYQVMIGNFWVPEKVSGLKIDARDLKESLSKDEERAYKGILSFLIFLDSIQTVNLPNISNYITSPEVNLILALQAFQEGIHSQSYATILESVVTPEERDEIYYLFREDKILLERNKYIGGIYQDFIDNQNDENFFKVIVANFLLESLYFYNGFAFFDTLVSNMKMPATGRMIAYIRRDELCLHPDTEVLTSEGWKLIGDVTTSDYIAQIDLETEALSFDNPIHKTWREYKGTMVNVTKSGNSIQNITEGHDVVVRTRSGKLIKEKIEESKFNPYKEYIQGGHRQRGIKELSFLDRLNIAIQADGNIDKQRTGVRSGFQVVHFGLTKERKRERLEWILSNIEGIEYTNKNGNYYVKVPLKYSVYKYFEFIDITKISTDYAKEFLDELKYWDGSIRNDGGGIVYVTNNTNVKDIVQSILVLSGLRNTIGKSVKEGYRDCYKVNYWLDKSGVHTQNLVKNNYEYEGMVGCVTMPNGTIVTRYNGFVTVMGNCHITIFANIIKEIKKEFPSIYNEQLIIDMTQEAVNQEIEWSRHILGNKIPGMNEETTVDYTRWLANNRMGMLGIDNIYPSIKNPYLHLDRIQDTNGDKGNFFETTVVNYTQSSNMNGTWDF